MPLLRNASPKQALALRVAITAIAGLLVLLLVNSLRSESSNSVNAGLATSSLVGIPSDADSSPPDVIPNAPAPTPIATTAPLVLPTATVLPTPTPAPAPVVPPTATAVATPLPAPTPTAVPAAAEVRAADGAISVADATSAAPAEEPTPAPAAPATAEPTATVAAPTATAIPVATATPACDPNYIPCLGFTIGDVLDCDDLTTVVQVIGTDTHNLDADGDGFGCEEDETTESASAAEPTPAPSPTPVQLETTADLENYVLGKINQVRANAGLGPVALSSAISTISRDWSQQMGQGGFFFHRPSNELNTMLPAGWRQWGENIASAPDIFYAQSSLEQSPGHYANMVGSFTHVGIGVYSANGQVWLTQNFARY